MSPGRPSRPSRRDGGPRGKASRSPSRRAPKPLTEAERRAKDVKARRGPRPERDPGAEQRRIEERTTEQWIDEGSVRAVASDATRRATSAAPAGRPPKSRTPLTVDPDVELELVDVLGRQRGQRLAERLAQASEALDRERFHEARRIASAVATEAPSVAAAHELAGLANYRLGNYKQAAKSLVQAQDLHANPALLPVIADCYRAQRRWSAVDGVWREIKAQSPAQDVMAEGRIVAAGALADRGELSAALELLEPATKMPKTVREHHLRQWYVIADLYDRVGDPINARRWFAAVADYDRRYADVEDRLRGLGR